MMLARDYVEVTLNTNVINLWLMIFVLSLQYMVLLLCAKAVGIALIIYSSVYSGTVRRRCHGYVKIMVMKIN